jgi:hypothetical protein
MRLGRWRVRTLVPLCAAAIAFLAVCIPTLRHALLRSAGWALVASDPLHPVDVIVIAGDADGAGTLEAADLVREGISARIAVFSVPLDGTGREFLRRGVPYSDLFVWQLHALGIKSVEVIPLTEAGTHEEGRVLPRWCIENGYRTVLLVSTPDHSRRTRRILRRAAVGDGLEVLVRYTRYSDFDPDAWWHTRAGTRTELSEAEKLLLDLLSHPLS